MRAVVTAVLTATCCVGAAVAPALAADPMGSPTSWTYSDPTNRFRWNPCEQVDVLVNEQRMPGGANDVREALWRLGQASGLVFRYRGTTDFVPTKAASVPAGTDLVVAWVGHAETDAWSGFTSAGFAGSRSRTTYRPDGTLQYAVSQGYVLMDPEADLDPGVTTTRGATTRVDLLMHESAHVAGLGHVDDETQIMNPIVLPHDGQWGAGDLNGLAAVGAKNGCLYPTKELAAANAGSVPPQPSGPYADGPAPTPTSPATPAPATPTPVPPTPTPTASPAPAPAVAAPTLTLSPTTLSAGEPTTVTYVGTPGATVDVLSRTQPSTVFTKIATVVLDADGTGRSTHKPQKNTRITARSADGTMSTTAPVIAVRSVASVNVRQTAARTYAFTGRVYPALANRLVNLYRNGTLAAQGRSDASGLYSITKALPAGASVLQVRTPDDQSNLGTRSRELPLTVR